METPAPMSAQRTFWHLEANRRVPSAYELKSSKLLYYPGRGFEVATPVGAWFERYQTGSPLSLAGLEQFRDPRQTTYASYVALAREKESFVDGLLRSADDTDYDARLPETWVRSLESFLPVLLYPCHGLQMVTAYVAHLAPVSEVVIALAFQQADEIRRVQRLAQRVAMLRKVRPGFGERGRALWQDAAPWQPLRRIIEELVVTYDFGEAFVRLGLVVKPLFDAFFVEHAGRLAESQRDPLLCRLFFSLQEDCRWHESVADDLVHALISNSSANRALMSGWVRSGRAPLLNALAALEPLWGPKLEPFRTVLDAVEARTAERLRRLGLDLEARS
jgi:toluene monooxygenase system protein E